MQKAIGMNKQNVFNILSQHLRPKSRKSAGGLGVGLVVILLSSTESSNASTNGAETCDRVARIAASETGVPLEVLFAITRTETGRTSDGKLAPWPWTVNMEGKGVWFDNQKEALTYALSHFQAGARSFDVGCFQLNYRWHGENFTDVEHMFEPMANARYAADFLSRLYTETQDWDDAAASYHSRTPEYANKYKARFKRIKANLPEQGSVPVKTVKPLLRTTKVVHENRFPLLQKGGNAATFGSLVPLSNGAGRSLFSNGG